MKEGMSRETALVDEDGDILWVEPESDALDAALHLPDTELWILTPALRAELARLLLDVTEEELTGAKDAATMYGGPGSDELVAVISKLSGIDPAKAFEPKPSGL